MFALPDCALTPMTGLRRPMRIAPEICAGIFAFAAAMHAGPGTEGSGADDGCAVRHLKREGGAGGMGQACSPARIRDYKVSLAS